MGKKIPVLVNCTPVRDPQRAFDLIASLLEDVNNRGDSPSTPVWDAAGEFCNELRDRGMIRSRYLKDYSKEGEP